MTRYQTVAECEQEMRRLRDAMGRLASFDSLTNAQTADFTRYAAEFDAIDADRLGLVTESQRQELRDSYRSGVYRMERGSGGEEDPARAPGVHGEARAVVDRLAARGALSAGAAQTVTAMVESGSARSRDEAAGWVRVAGDEDYASAFAALVRDPTRGHLRWSEREAAAFRAVEDWRESQRAMTLAIDSGGGYLAPLIIDPSVILTNAGTVSPLRTLARVVTLTQSAWAGVTSEGVSAEWHDPELTEVAASQPVLAPVKVPACTLDVYTEFSFELGMDAPNLLSELGMLMADAADRAQAEAFVSGTGANGQPQGIVTGLDGTPSEMAPTTPETITPADLYRVQGDLPVRWQPGASWLGSMGVLNMISQMGNTTADMVGARIAEELNAGRLLRRPVAEVSDLPAGVDAGAPATNAGALIYGDIAAGYLIAVRSGTVVELVPNIVGPSRRPVMARGLLSWLRVGAGVVVPDAMRMLSVPTTA